MSRAEYLAEYAKGWRADDIGTTMGGLADSDTFDLPNTGVIPVVGITHGR